MGHTAASSSLPNTPGFAIKSQYVESGLSRRNPGSPTSKPSNPVGRPRTNTANNARKRQSQPNTPTVPSPLIRQNYVDSSMQTEPEGDDAWYRPPAIPPTTRKPYLSLTKRLLLRSQRDRVKLEKQRNVAQECQPSIQSNGTTWSRSGNQPMTEENEDIEMQDAASTESMAEPIASENGILSKPQPPAYRSNTVITKPPPPWPTGDPLQNVNGHSNENIRLQLPLKPPFSSDPASNYPLVETPTSSIPQSPLTHHPTTLNPSFPQPLSNVVQPSPIKKKVSLGEYFSRRKGSQPATDMRNSKSPTMLQGTVKAPILTNGNSKDSENHGSAVVDTPKGEEGNHIEKGKDHKP